MVNQDKLRDRVWIRKRSVIDVTNVAILDKEKRVREWI